MIRYGFIFTFSSRYEVAGFAKHKHQSEHDVPSRDTNRRYLTAICTEHGFDLDLFEWGLTYDESAHAHVNHVYGDPARGNHAH